MLIMMLLMPLMMIIVMMMMKIVCMMMMMTMMTMMTMMMMMALAVALAQPPKACSLAPTTELNFKSMMKIMVMMRTSAKPHQDAVMNFVINFWCWCDAVYDHQL